MRYLLIVDDFGTPESGHPAPSGRRLARLLRYAHRSCGLKSLMDPPRVPESLGTDLLKARMVDALRTEGEREQLLSNALAEVDRLRRELDERE